jgi:hypothetical protein
LQRKVIILILDVAYYDAKNPVLRTALHIFVTLGGKLASICIKQLLTISMAQEPEGSSPHSQQPATGPS